MVDPLENKVEEPSVEKPKKKKPLLFLVIGFVVVVGAGIGIFLFGPKFISKKSKGEAAESKRESHGHVYGMDSFLVNLGEPDSARYLKVKIDIESTSNKPDEEYQQRLPQLRDSIITVLSSKRYQDVYDSEGKKKLKEEIISRLNQSVNHFKVKAVYFTEFVVQ